MKSRTTRGFRQLFDKLPVEAQAHARDAYRPFRSNPAHPELHFKRVNRKKPVYSARIGIRCRAVGLVEDDTITWSWIGPDDDYERLLGM